MDSLKDRLGDLEALFDKAELVIKEVETFQDDLIIPAINELRYAGHHLLKALNSEESEMQAVQLERCRAHCLRAIYEAYESGIALALDRIRTFQEDYRHAVVTDVVSDYVDVLQRAEEARRQLIVKRAPDDERQNDFSRLEELFERLKDDACRLDLVREEINKKLRRDRVTFWILLLTFVATIIGVGIAALSYMSS